MVEPMSDAELAEIGAEHHRSYDERWDCAKDGDKYPCATARLLDEVRRLRYIIRDVAAAPRDIQPDPWTPELAGLAWAVVPREFMDMLDREVGATARPMEIPRGHGLPAPGQMGG